MRIPIFYQIENLIRAIRNKTVGPDYKIAKLQDKSFKKNFANSKKMIVFVNFADNDFCGGIMTIFYYARISRKMKHIHGCDVLHANFFNKNKRYYINQPKFKNDETMYRLDLVMEHAKKLDTLILHVPELLMEDFAKMILPYKDVLKNIKNFQINVLNQNVDVFSPPETWESLFNLTQNITQISGFKKYSTQEICNKFGVPLYYLPSYHDTSNVNDYGKKSFKDKEKLFIYSLDYQPNKEEIIETLKQGLPDFELKQIQELTYDEYLAIAQKAMFSLTFGEGYDGYFVEPTLLGGVGFTVYNDRFFPSEKYKELPTVFKSYEELNENILNIVNHYMNNPEEYDQLSQRMNELNHQHSFKPELTYEALEKFYKKEPTLLPQKNMKEDKGEYNDNKVLA